MQAGSQGRRRGTLTQEHGGVGLPEGRPVETGAGIGASGSGARAGGGAQSGGRWVLWTLVHACCRPRLAGAPRGHAGLLAQHPKLFLRGPLASPWALPGGSAEQLCSRPPNLRAASRGLSHS